MGADRIYRDFFLLSLSLSVQKLIWYPNTILEGPLLLFVGPIYAKFMKNDGVNRGPFKLPMELKGRMFNLRLPISGRSRDGASSNSNMLANAYEIVWVRYMGQIVILS